MVPLVVRSHFSLMWGASSVERLCRVARLRGYSRLALTDTDNLYGLWPFLEACRAEGIRPLVGAEVTEPSTGRRAVCLVQDAAGFENLCRLISRRQAQGETFCLRSAVARRAGGLVVPTAHPRLLAAWRDAEVTVAAQLPRRASVTPARVRQAARRLGVPLVAVPGAFFAEPDEHPVHRVLRAMALKLTLSRLRPQDTAPPDAWLAGPRRYARRFEVDPSTIHATEALAERCAFTGPCQDVVLPPWHDPARSAEEVLRQEAYEGARRRYGDDLSEAAVERLEYELRIIGGKGFSAYFLVVQEIVRRSPRVCGRGSGAASLVAYCLGITNVCPLKYNLYFERFLNPGRADPPDIDVDFAWDERDDVLAWVLRRHGDHAAMVCNHVRFRPRMAIREVARTFGLGDREISRVVGRLPSLWHDGPTRGSWVQPRLDPRALDTIGPPWPQVLELAARVVGTPRLLSVHPGGMVITPGPIRCHAPVELAVKEVLQGEVGAQVATRVPIVQWEKDGTEESGLVKIDLLGNRSLAVIRDAVANAADNGRPLDEERWEPEDDAATQEAVAQGATMGCFYIESPAMRLLQQKTGKGDFEHLVIHSSIIRPAANEFIREYVRRLRGGDWEPIHPLLEDVLDETFGIMVYQEDVSRAAVALAGFSHAEADGLRKILSKKDREQQLRDYARRFADGARARGVTDDQQQRVWAMMMSFQGYSFCKPHSASYARVSFQAAYLKVHYPAEFMAAVIQNGGGFYSAFAYVSEARRLGLTVQPPCVCRGEDAWGGDGRRVRVGLMSIKSLGLATRERLVATRAQRPFQSMEDFLARARPDIEEARALIHAGACDALAVPGEDRAGLLWRCLAWHRQKKRCPDNPGRRVGARKHRRPALDLFDRAASIQAPPPLPPVQERARLRRQFAALGFLCDRHPMELYAAALAGREVIKAAHLRRHAGRRVCCAGWLITGKLVPTKKGEPMEFLTFEDETGVMETTFFPRAYRAFCHILDWNRPFILWGKVEQDFGAVTLTVDRVERLANPKG